MLVKYVCKFCNADLDEAAILPPDCDCEGYKAARQKQVEELKASKGYEPQLDKEEYDRRYPQTFLGERLIQDKDGIHKLKLEARRYGDGEGLTVWIPIPYQLENEMITEDDKENVGLCWDFTKPDAGALYDLLGEYLGVKSEHS